MVRAFAQKMTDAEVEVACGAGYEEVSPSRVNSRNGYRALEWDTRVGAVELAIPKLRHGSYFLSFLEHRRRAGLAGSQMMSAAVDIWGWRARIRLARGQTISDVIAKIPAGL
jgi:transposase-like protein